jgi:hypothetical protein
MNFSKAKKVFLIGGYVLSIGLIFTWPLSVERQFFDSLKIYHKYIFGGKVRVSDLLGTVDIACAVGPYESYDSRFSKFLTEKQIFSANTALNIRNEISSGDNRFFLVGFRGETVSSTYTSNFFSNLQTTSKNSYAELNCISGDGFIFPEKLNGVIAIRMIKGF